MRDSFRRSVRWRMAVSRLEILALVVVLALAAWLVIPSLGAWRVTAQREECLAHLTQIGQALGSYLKDSGNRWPYIEKLRSAPRHDPAWPTLPDVLQDYGAQAAVFRCPADRRILPEGSPLADSFPNRTTWFDTEGTSYEWWHGEDFGGRKVGEETLSKSSGFGLGRADQWLIADFDSFHEGDDEGPFNTLNADLTPRTTRARAR